MYEGGLGAGATTTAAGVLVLPNTGGRTWLTVVAITSIVVGAVILLSSAARLIAKHTR